MDTPYQPTEHTRILIACAAAVNHRGPIESLPAHLRSMKSTSPDWGKLAAGYHDALDRISEIIHFGEDGESLLKLPEAVEEAVQHLSDSIISRNNELGVALNDISRLLDIISRCGAAVGFDADDDHEGLPAYLSRLPKDTSEPEWYYLEHGEIIQEGDQFYCQDTQCWCPTVSPGVACGTRRTVYRRKVEKQPVADTVRFDTSEPGWRYLEPGEIIRPGDQFYSPTGDRWEPSIAIGHTCPQLPLKYRRKVEKQPVPDNVRVAIVHALRSIPQSTRHLRWVAMDGDGDWWAYLSQPSVCMGEWDSGDSMADMEYLEGVPPVANWTKSLIKLNH